MKKLLLFFNFLAFFGMFNLPISKTDDVKRTIKMDDKIILTEYAKEFEESSIEVTDEMLKFNATKSIDSQILNEIDLSIEDEEKVIAKYFSKFDYSNSTVEVECNLYKGDQLISTDVLYGYCFANENNDIDAIVEVDDETYLLSELVNASKIDNCGWISKILKKAVKAIVSPVVVVVASQTGSAVALAVATAATTYMDVSWEMYDVVCAKYNYQKNILLENPTSLINGQLSYSKWRFGNATLGKNGCGPIAIFNILFKLNKKPVLADIIFYFETHNGLLLSGFLGGDPTAVKEYFKYLGIKCSNNYGTYEKLQNAINDMSTSQMVFLGAFCGNPILDGAHYVAISKPDRRLSNLMVYNLYADMDSACLKTKVDKSLTKGEMFIGYIVG